MRKFYLVLCALCLLWTQNASAQRIPNPWDEPPIKGVSRAWLREFYFYQPRVMPFNQLPPNFRLNAWNQAQQLPVIEPDPPLFGIQSFTSWESMGPTATNTGYLGRVNAIVVDRTNAATVYVGEAKGGVWKSTDSGTTWTNLTDTITQYVGCLVQDPVNANTLYLGTGEEYNALNTQAGVGIYKSTDGGATWTLKGNATFAGRRINQIVIDPGNTNNWVVCCDSGIYTTIDGGTTFTLRLSGVGSALRLHPTNSAILYAAIGWPFGGTAANGVYKSTNNGVNWTLLGGGLPSGTSTGRIELDIHKANPNVVYAAIGNPASPYALNSIYRTADGGTTWTSIPLPTMSANRDTWYNIFIRADPTSATTVYYGQVTLHRSTNAGAAATWTTITPVHPDMHALEFDPTNSSKIYLGEDAGLFYSTDQGATWTHKNNGRAVMEYYAFAVHPNDDTKLIAGAQDNSTHVRTGTNTFNVVIGGDGFWPAYKASDPTIMLGEYQYGNISRSTNSGATWTGVFAVPNGYWSTPIVNDPTTPARFYTGGIAVYRSADSGATWGAVSATLDGNYIMRIAVAPNNSNVVYAGTLNGGFFATIDGAATWVNRTAGLPGVAIGAIGVHPTTASTVYVGMTGGSANRVWKSTNNGTTWANYTGNLPNTPVNGLAVNPVNTAQVVAATDVGIFITSDGVSWARYGSDFPNTPATHIVANGTTGYLSVSTYGRGMWRIPLPGSNLLPFITSLTPNSIGQGSPAFTLTVDGDNFVAASKVRWNGADRTTTFVSATRLTAAIPASDLTALSTVNVTVFNPPPNGGTSFARLFTIRTGLATFSGDTTGELLYKRVEQGQPPTLLATTNGTSVPYTVFKVTVPTTGIYSFNIDCNYDAFSTLYSTDFDPSAALTNALVANDDKVNTSHTGFDNIAMTAGTTYYLVVSGYANSSFGTFTGTITGPGDATVTQLRYVTGTVTLQGLVAAGYPQTLSFQFRPTAGGTNINKSVTVGSSGAFTVINVPAANYNLAVKGSRWLQSTTARNVTAGNLSGVAVTLKGGDANNDNVVDINDLLLLVAHYNQTSPSAGYSLAADFNGDGSDDINDLLLLIGNYNVIGDP